MTELTFFEYVYNTFKNFILYSSDYDSDSDSDSDFDLWIEDHMDVNDDDDNDNDNFDDFDNVNPFNPGEPQLNPAPIPRNRILPNYDDFMSLFNNPAFHFAVFYIVIAAIGTYAYNYYVGRQNPTTFSGYMRNHFNNMLNRFNLPGRENYFYLWMTYIGLTVGKLIGNILSPITSLLRNFLKRKYIMFLNILAWYIKKK